MYVHFPHIHQEKHAIFDKSERKLVNALDEMRSLWQEFVRRKAADTTVSMATNNNSTVYVHIYFSVDQYCNNCSSESALDPATI